MADIERLDRALAWIEAHPEQHDQGVWARDVGADGKVNCGTAMCLAGWVVAQEDPDATFIRDDIDTQMPGMMHSTVRTGAGDVESVEDLAGRLLDVTPGQREALFSAGNTIEDLKAMRGVLVDNPDAAGIELEDACGYGEDYECDCLTGHDE